MMIALHKNARTTPAIRAEMAASSETAATLALRYGVSEGTVYKWKGRDSFLDASHTPQRLQTTLTPAQEKIVVELRKMLLLPLDDHPPLIQFDRARLKPVWLRPVLPGPTPSRLP